MSKSVSTAAQKSTKSQPAYCGAYRQGTSYWAIVNAVHTLGYGKFHPIMKIVELFPGLLGKEAFGEFKNRQARNEETHKSWEGRVCVNALVTCRNDKYGQPLRDHAVEMRKQHDENGYAFGLFDAEPQTERKTARKASPKAASSKATASKPQKAVKTVKGQKSGPKATKAQKAKKTLADVLVQQAIKHGGKK